MNSLKLILLTATFMLAMAFTFSCSSGGGGGDNNGNAKSDCIKSELQIKANTLDNVAAACDAIRSEVLSQLSDNVGNCNKNDLSFDKPIGNILSECGESEVPVVGGGSSGAGVDISALPFYYCNGERGKTEGNNKVEDIRRYEGNGDIEIIIVKYEQGENYINELFSDTLSAGRIQNGKVTLNLSQSIDSKYLEPLVTSPCNGHEPCESNISYPRDLSFVNGNRVRAIISGKYCDLYLEADAGAEASFLYVSKSVDVKGTEEYAGNDYPFTMHYDLELSKGWNITYIRVNEQPRYLDYYYTTSRPQTIEGEWKWQAYCPKTY